MATSFISTGESQTDDSILQVALNIQASQIFELQMEITLTCRQLYRASVDILYLFDGMCLCNVRCVWMYRSKLKLVSDTATIS